MAVSGALLSASPAGAAEAAPESVLRLQLSATTLTYGNPIRVSATLQTRAGTPVAGDPVALWSRPLGSSAWSSLSRGTTSSTGAVSVVVRPGITTEYLATHAASARAGLSHSLITRASVRTRISTAVSRTSLAVGETFDFTGSVAPAHPGHRIHLQHYKGGGVWETIQSGSLNSASAFRFITRAYTAGAHLYRALKTSDGDHIQTESAPLRVEASSRDLRSGMSGPDVVSLQQRLAALGYDVGPQDQNFDYDTHHAVVAFQKTERMARTGVVDAGVRARLASAARPRLSFPRPGLSIEVDITRQVVMVGRDGGVVRVLDASSGSGEYYYQRGARYRAVTPEGSFKVTRKINDWRESDLGMLYRPIYFYQGFAIHGSGSVPTYPASHGCVRITIGSMDRLYDAVPVGTPVRLYRS